MRANVERSSRYTSPSQRLRSRSRPPPGSGVIASAGAGSVSITPIQEPGQLEVGETQAFHYDIQAENASDPGDPDWCIASGIGDGYDVTISARVGGNLANADDTCINAGFNRTAHRFSFELTGRSEGTIDVRIAVHGTQSGNLIAEHNFQLTIGSGTGGGSVDPSEPPSDDNGNGHGGAILPCFIDPNRSCQTPELVAWTAVGAVGSVMILSAAAN